MANLLLLFVGITLCATTSVAQLNQCFQPPRPGFCRAFIPSFFYNPVIGACDCYVFGGCNPSANHFSRIEDCMATCGVNPSQQFVTPDCQRLMEPLIFFPSPGQGPPPPVQLSGQTPVRPPPTQPPQPAIQPPVRPPPTQPPRPAIQPPVRPLPTQPPRPAIQPPVRPPPTQPPQPAIQPPVRPPPTQPPQPAIQPPVRPPPQQPLQSLQGDPDDDDDDDTPSRFGFSGASVSRLTPIAATVFTGSGITSGSIRIGQPISVSG